LFTALLLVGLWFLGSAAGGLDADAAAAVAWLAPSSHLERMLGGTLAVADVGYFVVVIAACAVLCARMLDARRGR
jgi:hypothetical protein